MRRAVLTLIALPVLAACDGAGPPPSEPPPIGPAFQATTTVLELMEWILEPATEGIWDAAGTIITAEGERELAPTTDAGWAHVRNSAALVAETGNLLMMPGRSAGDDWNGFAGALIVAGQESMAAADAQDSDRLFEAGGELYQACLACHRQYMPGSR